MKGEKLFALAIYGVLSTVTLMAVADEAEAPAFTTAAINMVYEIGGRDLHAVDFGTLTYEASGVAPGLSITLRHGTYYAREGVGFERAELLDASMCDAPYVASPFAIVRLRYVSGAGSSNCDEIVQMFRVRDGRLAALYEIVYACGPDGAYRVDCGQGTLTATTAVWLGSDPHCCPSARDTATFAIAGGSLRLSSWRREDEGALPGD